ncbi:MAG: substrate-binding periplasmic protein [Christensenellales bacterium]|jgi:putative glutamine transport system substrate-binding protein
MNWRPLGAKIRAAIRSLDKREWLVFGVFGAVVLAILLALMLQPGPDPFESAEIATILDRGVLRVGVRGDVPSFGYEDSEGNRTGLEVDLANLLAAHIFGSPNAEFSTVNFNTMPAKLRRAQIDCCVALAQTGMSTSLVYSEPYYTDAVAIMVLDSSPYQSPEDLAGRTIGCINRDGSNMRYVARNALYAFAAMQSPKCTVVEYASSADMIADLASGKLSGVCMEYALLFSYFSADTHRILPQAIGTISYSFAFQPESKALVEIANEMLRKIRADGTLDALLQQWNLEDYSKK